MWPWLCRPIPAIRFTSGVMLAVSRNCAIRRVQLLLVSVWARVRSFRHPLSATANIDNSNWRWRSHPDPACCCWTSPWPGLGPEESARMVSMLRDLKKELTILLVEHDMEAVFALADRITVLVYGRVIASGKPEDIRNNPQVRDAYLGEQEAVHG